MITDRKIKKFLKENLSLKEIFANSGFQKTLQRVADSSMKYYGFKPIPIRVCWDSDNSDIAWISDKECYINLDSPLDKGLSFRERTIAGIGKNVHEEFGHGLHTDFTRCIALQESDKDFPFEEYFSSFGNFISIKNAYIQNKDLFNRIFFNVANIVEDPVVEYLAIKKYPGFKRYVEYLKSLLVKNIMSQMVDVNEPMTAITLVLHIARDCFNDKYLAEFPELASIRCFEDLSLMPTYEDRLYATAEIVSILWKYIEPSFEEAQKMQDMMDFLSNFCEQMGIGDDQSQAQPSEQQSDGNRSNAPQNSQKREENKRTQNGQANEQNAQNSPSDVTTGQGNGSATRGSINSQKEDNKDTQGNGSEQDENSHQEQQNSQKNEQSSSNNKDKGEKENGYKENTSNNTNNENSNFPKRDLDQVVKNAQKNQESNDGGDVSNEHQASNDNKPSLEDIFDEMSKMADQTVDKVIDEYCAASDSEKLERGFDQACARKFMKGSTYQDFGLSINYPSTLSIDEYNSIFSTEKKRVAKTLSKKVSKALTEKRKGNILYALDEGSMLDINSYSEGSDKIFMDVTAPTKRPLCSVGVMIDQSGSMSGSRAAAACNMALILEYFCRELKIPTLIYGHYQSGNEYIQNFVDFRDKATNKTATKLLHITKTGGCNHDGVAIRYGISKLSNRQEPQKILFVISDGRPNGSGYGTYDMIKEMPDLKKMCKKNHIMLIPIAIGDDIENLKEIYGNSLVDGRDLSKLPTEVSKILLREIKKLI